MNTKTVLEVVGIAVVAVLAAAMVPSLIRYIKMTLM